MSVARLGLRVTATVLAALFAFSLIQPLADPLFRSQFRLP